MMVRGTLSRRILAILAAGLGLASLVFLALFIEVYRERLSMERGNASEQVNRLLQVSLENAMLKRDLPGLQEIVRKLGGQTGIAGVVIAAPSMEVRFASDPDAIGKMLTLQELGCPGCERDSIAALPATTQLFRRADGKEVLRSVNPIRNQPACKECHGPAEQNPVNGILVVDHDAAGIRKESLQAAIAMSGAGLFVVLLGLGSVWLFLKRQVLAPIIALDDASRTLASGDLKARVALDAGRNDELADLCVNFNTMAGTIEKGVREVNEKEAFLKALIDTVPDGVRVLDEDRKVVMANSAYARQSLASLETLIGVPCYAIHGRDEPCPPTLITCPYHAIHADGEPIKYIHRHVRSDGTELHVETTAARLTIEREGKPRVLIIEAIRDLEQQVKYSQEQRLSEIGQLAAGIAHEIYNPLASIRLGLHAVLRRGRTAAQLDTETSEYLGMVDGEVEKCIRVTKRLLDLSQAPSQNLQLVSLSTIAPEVVSLLRYEAEHGNVKLELDMGEVDLRVLATDSELRMLVLNLVQNAFHAMPEGGTLRVVGRVDEDRVVMRVSDTGVGIEPDVVPMIFDPFFSRRADGIHGTGLGLTICKAITARYQGRIDVESRLGQGTTFTVSFPPADASKAFP